MVSISSCCPSVYCAASLTQTKVMGGGTLTENASIKLTWRQDCGIFSGLMIDVGGCQPIVSGAIPRQVVLHSLCIGSRLQIPVLSSPLVLPS